MNIDTDNYFYLTIYLLVLAQGGFLVGLAIFTLLKYSTNKNFWHIAILGTAHSVYTAILIIRFMQGYFFIGSPVFYTMILGFLLTDIGLIPLVFGKKPKIEMRRKTDLNDLEMLKRK